MKLSYEDYKRIQTMKAAGYNGNQVSIKLGYTQYAVYKVWDMSEAQFLSVKQTRCDSLDKYRQFVVETLRSQPLLTSSQVLDKIKENFNEDIPASLPTFYRFMRLLRQKEGFVQANQTRQSVWQQYCLLVTLRTVELLRDNVKCNIVALHSK